MNSRLLDHEARTRALAVRDLTDPAEGPHAMQSLVQAALRAAAPPHGSARVVRGPRIVSVQDNYDALRFPRDAVTREARYTRYVAAGAVLRTHTSALVPAALRALAAEPETGWTDLVLGVPGVVYRRDCIDRLHSGEPHQMDLWRVRRGTLGEGDLHALVAAVATALLPDRDVRTTCTEHPYTLAGLQIDVRADEGWVEIGECGLAHPDVLAGAGLEPREVTGLAMGLGLDRVFMLRKGVPDIRLLRSTDPRVSRQMADLEPYRPVSSMPAVRRDLSIAVDEDVTPEELGDRVRVALGRESAAVEEIAVLSETPGDALPPAARARLGLGAGQKNVLLRVVLRDLERTLTHAEANGIRNAIYAALHEGSVQAWAV